MGRYRTGVSGKDEEEDLPCERDSQPSEVEVRMRKRRRVLAANHTVQEIHWRDDDEAPDPGDSVRKRCESHDVFPPILVGGRQMEL
jgi:hypothetical protein